MTRQYDALFAIRPHHDLVAQLARELPTDGVVLDAGCGTGWLGRLAPPSPSRLLVGADMSPAMVQAASATDAYAQLHQAPLHRLPLGDATVHHAACINVLYAVGNSAQQAAALAELNRVLVSGGTLALANPVTSALWPLITQHFRTATLTDQLRLMQALPEIIRWASHVMRQPPFSFLNEAELQNLAMQAGFRVESVTPAYAGIDRLLQLRKKE